MNRFALQDIVDHVREYRDYEIASDHILGQDEFDADAASQSSDKLVSLEGEKSYDHIIFNLKSFLHACINANMMDKAHNAFIWYRYRLLQVDDGSAPVLEAPTYNVLLKAWANAGKVNKVKELFRLMALANVSPNIKSYSYYMLSLARQPNCDTEYVKRIAEEMKSKGYTLERLFIKSVLNTEQRKCTEKMLRSIYPDLRLFRGPFIDRNNLDLLKSYRPSHFPERIGCKSDDLKHWSNEQISHEKQGFVKMKRVYAEATVSEAEDMRKIWDKHEIEWRNVLKEKIAGNLLIYKNRHMELQGINIYPYLVSVDSNDLIDIVIQHLTNLDCITDHHSPPCSVLHRALGARVEAKYLTHVVIKNGTFADRNRIYIRYLEDITRGHEVNSRVMLSRIARELGVDIESDIREMRWPDPVQMSVGRFLYEIILNDLKVNGNTFSKKKESAKPVPVLFSFYKTDQLKLREEIRPHPVFNRLQKSICGSELIFETRELPMLCPPLPWLSQNAGGYLIMPTPFVREFQLSSKLNRPNKQYVAVLDALNSLQMQPWIVNQPVSFVANILFLSLMTFSSFSRFSTS